MTTIDFIVLGILLAPAVFGTIAWWVSRRGRTYLPPGPGASTTQLDDPLGYAQTEAIARRAQGPKL